MTLPGVSTQENQTIVLPLVDVGARQSASPRKSTAFAGATTGEISRHSAMAGEFLSLGFTVLGLAGA